MAQEKQQPPLAKAARKPGDGQPKSKSGHGKSTIDMPLAAGDAAARPTPPKTPSSSAERSSARAGQPGGPNVQPVDAVRPAEKSSRSARASEAAARPDSARSEDNATRRSAQRDGSTRGGDRRSAVEQQVASQGSSQADRRRAAPARRRFAANDDVPSIGGLIFALQQKPSNRPFVIAGIASAVWVALSVAMVWSVFRSAFEDISTLAQLFQSTSALATVAVVAIPIALFWFLALLIWRAQELRLMSSAMTEVAVRLAEPDKAAEQSVASLGQSVRRQVTAMNDAISRALGRAGELEAMVHNEVAALERSYSENEIRIRALIGELAHERASLTSDSERISNALTGVGQRLTKQIEQQGMTTTKLLEQTSGNVASKLIESSEKVAQSMSEQSNAVVSNMTTMNDRVSREMPALLERMGQEQIKLNKVVENAGVNLSALDTSIGHHAGALNNALTERTQQLEGIFRKHVQNMSVAMEERSQTLDNALGNKIQTFDNTLLQRMDDFEDTLTSTTEKIDKSLTGKSQYLDMAISSRIAELDSALVERAKVIDAAFTERLHALDKALHTSSRTLDQAFAHRAEELGRTMDSRSQFIVQTIGAKTKELDNALMDGARTLKLTTEDVGQQLMSTIRGLGGQAQVLKEVSSGMQAHVSQITNSLREQSQLVLHAAAQLENSHDRIGSKLGSSQVNLQNLVDSISTRTSDLDSVMASYSDQLNQTLSQAEMKARQITESLHTQSHSQSMEALSELTKLRDAATSQTERAILDMKDRIASVSNEMSSQITSLSSEISDTQNTLKAQLQQIPDTTMKSAALMRRTLQDQLKALESLSSVSSGSNHVDISAPGVGGLNRAVAGQGGDPFSGQGLFGQNGLSSGGKQQQSPLARAGGNPALTDGVAGQSPAAGGLNDRLRGVGGQPQGGSPRDAGAERDLEIEAITETLAKRVSQQLDTSNVSITTPPRDAAPRGGSSHWSMGDLLARASEDDGGSDDNEMAAAPSSNTLSPLSKAGSTPETGAGNAPLPPINISAIAQLVDQSAAVELWRSYRSGLRTPISETVYNDNGEAFRRISGLYVAEATFRSNVDRYISDFERLLNDAERKDPTGNLSTKHLTSESGRVYLLLMHAAGRIGK